MALDNYSRKYFIVGALLVLFVVFDVVSTLYFIPNGTEPGDGASFWIGIFMITVPPLIVFLLAWRYLNKQANEGSKEDQALRKNGIRAQATVVSVDDTGITVGGVNPMVKIALRVKPLGGEAFESSISTFVSRVSIPRKGDVLEVIFDPNDHKKLILA